ncbi:MAG: hypothetical protein G01um10143_312 [Parcubacteria group bacterium Gr01-1014_3]|nr:MAG: hypothetical protein G01um10143_312 [Parcubacteria group bacterium Gr01-1014_3]
MKLSNEYIRGLVDGEGCFTFHTRSTTKDGLPVKEKMPAFALVMHIRDKELIEAVRDHLGLKSRVYIHKPQEVVGSIRGLRAALMVRNFGDLKNIIIPFFYGKLKGHKSKQFVDWLEKIGSDPMVADTYKVLHRLYKTGWWDRNALRD